MTSSFQGEPHKVFRLQPTFLSKILLQRARGHPSNTSSPMGGGGHPKVDDRGRGKWGRPLDKTSISDDFEQILYVSDYEDTSPSSLSTVVRIAKYVAFSDVSARYGPDGGGGFHTDDVRQGGGSKKSFFARTSLMDDPLSDR